MKHSSNFQVRCQMSSGPLRQQQMLCTFPQHERFTVASRARTGVWSRPRNQLPQKWKTVGCTCTCITIFPGMNSREIIRKKIKRDNQNRDQNNSMIGVVVHCHIAVHQSALTWCQVKLAISSHCLDTAKRRTCKCVIRKKEEREKAKLSWSESYSKFVIVFWLLGYA